jgi:ribosome-associated protein
MKEIKLGKNGECFSFHHRYHLIMNKEQLISELQFKAIRSSGPGGQHVNKVSSKIELSYNLEKTTALNDEEKLLITTKLANRINKDNILILQCDESRSQIKNKGLVVKRLIVLLEAALVVPKARKKLKPSKAMRETRLNNKRHQSLKKESRRRPEL